MCSTKFFSRGGKQLFNLNFFNMNKLSISKDKVSLCYKNNCVDVKGNLAKVVTFSIALVVIFSGIASLSETSK